MKTKRYEAKDEDELLRLIDEDSDKLKGWKGPMEAHLRSVRYPLKKSEGEAATKSIEIKNIAKIKSVKVEKNISAKMRKVHSQDTTPEMIFRRALWSIGLRYNVSLSKLPGKPDIAFKSKRIAIFIDGDFWHGNQWRKRNLTALEDQFRGTCSREYWLNKIYRNMQRDSKVTALLLSEGWTVLRVWESEIRKNLMRYIEMTLNVVKYRAKQDYFALLPQKTFAEFFAGIGLMRVGLERQSWSISFANDIDPEKYKMYKGHFIDAESHFLPCDIYDISADQVPTVTLMTASFPCNDLSLAGARQGLQGKQSSAFWGFIDILRKMESRRPPLVLLENVTGFLTSNCGKDFEQALIALNELGYSVDAFILDAANFVPQSRQRLFVVGVLYDQFQDEEVIELHKFYKSDVRPKALADFICSHPQIRWKIRKLPPQPQCKEKLEDILENLPESSSKWWSPERSKYLLNQMSPRHRDLAEKMITGSEYSYGTVFRRIRNGKSMAELRIDGVAGCLRTPRGGSGRQILFKAGKGRYFARLLTPRECSRLMGADDYNIKVPLNQALFGFGDAVCVPVIEWIAKHYLNPVVNELIRGKPLCLQYEGGFCDK